MALLISFFVLYMIFGAVAESILVMLCLPLVTSGGVWALYLFGYDMSIAAWMGMLVLIGFAVEGGVVMLIYIINETRQTEGTHSEPLTDARVRSAIERGALRRLRPRLMVLSLLILGLLPIFWGDAAGSSLMRRIAARIVGGMITEAAVIFLLLPPLYAWWLEHRQNPASGILKATE
jgi:Cu(I)/Ag(I) efflux system membrane protein CusA/SilA